MFSKKTVEQIEAIQINRPPSIATTSTTALDRPLQLRAKMNRAVVTRRAVAPCAVARPPTQTANRAPAPLKTPRSANVVGGSTSSATKNASSDLRLLSSLAPGKREFFFCNSVSSRDCWSEGDSSRHE